MFEGWGRHLRGGTRTAAKPIFALTRPSNLRETGARTSAHAGTELTQQVHRTARVSAHWDRSLSGKIAGLCYGVLAHLQELKRLLKEEACRRERIQRAIEDHPSSGPLRS